MCLKTLPDISKFTLGPFYILPKDSARGVVRLATAVSETSSTTSRQTDESMTPENIQLLAMYETDASRTENFITDEASTIITSIRIDSDDTLLERSAVLSGIDKRNGFDNQIAPSTFFEDGRTPTPSANTAYSVSLEAISQQKAFNATDTVFESRSSSTATVALSIYGTAKRRTRTQTTTFHDLDRNGESDGDIQLERDFISSSDQYQENVGLRESLTTIHLLNSAITVSPESSVSRSGSGSEYRHSGDYEDADESEKRDSRLSHKLDIDRTPTTTTGDSATQNAKLTPSTTKSRGKSDPSMSLRTLRHPTSSQSAQVGSPQLPKQRGMTNIQRWSCSVTKHFYFFEVLEVKSSSFFLFAHVVTFSDYFHFCLRFLD